MFKQKLQLQTQLQTQNSIQRERDGNGTYPELTIGKTSPLPKEEPLIYCCICLKSISGIQAEGTTIQ